MKDFKDLQVWIKSHSFVTELYASTSTFPKEELYGITSQIRRAAVSIPTNIAEGCGRGSDADFKRFLQIAFGSASEVEYLLILCNDLNYVHQDHSKDLTNKIIEIKKMLSGLILKLKN